MTQSITRSLCNSWSSCLWSDCRLSCVYK